MSTWPMLTREIPGPTGPTGFTSTRSATVFLLLARGICRHRGLGRGDRHRGRGSAAWLLWPLLDPYACQHAEEKIALAAEVVEDLPPALVARSRPVNDCDSGDDGWLEVTLPTGVGADAAASMLEAAGWSLDNRSEWGVDRQLALGRQYSREINERDVTIVVYAPRAADSPGLTVEVQ